jgi:hypothetical protein
MKIRLQRRSKRAGPQSAPGPAAPVVAGDTRVPGEPGGTELPLPHERDQATGEVSAQPPKVIRQAKADLDAGLVDTDMRATPGLDAERRAQLVKSGGA